MSIWLQSWEFWRESRESEWAIVILTFPNQGGKRLKTSGKAVGRREAKCVQRIKQWHVDICGLLFWGWRCKSSVCPAPPCKMSGSMLAVIYISCLWALVCIWLQRLTFLPLSYGTLLTRLDCTWPRHSESQSRHSDRFEKFKPLPLQNKPHVSTRRERWKYLEIFFFFCPRHSVLLI